MGVVTLMCPTQGWLADLTLKPPTCHNPYCLKFPCKEGELVVDQQVLMSFTIEKHKDVVLCDVAPIEACHILLGKPWQIERNVKHHRKSNKISFIYEGHKIKLAPLSPKETSGDQIKLRKKIEYERKEAKEKQTKDREMREK